MRVAFVSDFSQQLGLQSISSVLKAAGHQTRLFIDPQLFADDILPFKKLQHLFSYRKELIAGFKVYKPDLIGISVVTDFYQWACNMARAIKEELDIPVIFGGIHPTSVPERVIKNDFVDMLCVGEGEYPMLELANSMEQGKIDYSIKNIWFKERGRVIRNEVRLLIEDLDSLPMPDTDLYYLSSPHFMKSGLYITMGSYGCLYACSYCCHSYLRRLYSKNVKYFRMRSVDNLINELAESKSKYNMKFIVFMDNCFGYDMAWMREFSYKYKKRVGVKFGCLVHPDQVSPEFLRCLKLAGCYSIDMGIQSWNEDIRKNIFCRNTNNSVIEGAAQLIQKEGIKLMADSIFDLPDQREEDIIDSALRYTKIKPDRIYFYMLRYYPNTTITRNALKNGWLNADEYERALDGINAVNFVAGGDKTNKASVQLQILFYLIDLMPRWLSRYIIKKRLYRYFPVFFGPALVVVLRNILAFDMNARLSRAGAFYRYSHFIMAKIINKYRFRK